MNENIFGERVRSLRKARGFTQAELADKAGISRAHMNRIEVGNRTEIPPATVSRIAAALGVSLGDLYEGGTERLVPKAELLDVVLRANQQPAGVRAQLARSLAALLDVLEQDEEERSQTALRMFEHLTPERQREVLQQLEQMMSEAP